ncbi:putative isoamyl alcohol oxidase [Fusarium sporotrichioides]|uniref:Putative isoamyl alcohol oxidase n=1 Tax=Fusarium sporotrichioides TaxID=5514 RepID=A0A395SBQ1_FUSSP|nr:putative isoamyl alcohol oxidase [Fusarium sporotrichioides]
MKSILSLALLPLALFTGSSSAHLHARNNCRCLPSDDCWPSDEVWTKFNSTVNGALIATVPLGSPCHEPNYDEEACAAVKADWKWPMTHIETSSSVMQNWFANQSCDPFVTKSKPCTLGNYVSYAVKVSNARDVATAIKFAKTYNIRLVVRNTAHDYFGRSTGAGSLAIWTHHMKKQEVIQRWSDSLYTGPALKLGAGVQGYDSVEFAHDNGLTSVPGECPTVGLAGFTLGGGHSPLSTSFGMGADNALEYEVVTADGHIITATATNQHKDLYWAMSGGGGASFGVVTSMTVRAHKTTTIGGAKLTLVAGADKDAYYAAINRFHQLLPGMIGNDSTVTYILTGAYFAITPVTIANSTGDFVRDTILAPFTDYLTKAGLTFTASYSTLSFYDHYALYNGPLPGGSLQAAQFQWGGRLIPNSVVAGADFNKLTRKFASTGLVLAGSAGKFESLPGVSNAVPSAWRKAMISLQFGSLWDATRWDDMIADQKKMTEVYMPQLIDATPGSGTYMNEADFNEPNWKEVFYGSNWNRLVEIKKKYDPNSFFYNYKGVGSEAWTVEKNGRMCKA